MKYEEPTIWLSEVEETDIITLSNGQSGDGGAIDPSIGGWG